MRVVVALGGNALLKRGEPMTADVQRKNIAVAARALAPVVQQHQVVLTHGNGPQVGLLALQTAAYTAVEAYPLDVLGAETEGMIGYMIEQELGNLLPDAPLASILTMIEDTSGGVHDTLIAACDRYRYAFLGVEGYHDNCTDNLFAGLAELGLVPPEVPSPLNLFMNIPWDAAGTLRFAAPPKQVPGGYVRLRAEMDLVIAFSACPQDILPINGKAGKPLEAHFTVTGSSSGAST